ncbi:hypothetical protein BVX93_01555, partial [bacterium B13(2017)]
MNELNDFIPIENKENIQPKVILHDRKISREDLIKEMYEKYKNYKTLAKVAKDYNYTRERVRQYFVLGNKLGIINYKPFNRETFKSIKRRITKVRLIELFKKYGTVRSIHENSNLSISHINRLIKIY